MVLNVFKFFRRGLMAGDDQEEGVRAQGTGECNGESGSGEAGNSVETLGDIIRKSVISGETYNG